MKQETIDKYHLRILQIHLSEFAGQEDFVSAFKDKAMEILRGHMTQAEIEERISEKIFSFEKYSKRVWSQRDEDKYIVELGVGFHDIIDVYVEDGVRVVPFVESLYQETPHLCKRLLYRSDQSDSIKFLVTELAEGDERMQTFAVEITPADIEYKSFRGSDQHCLIEPYGLNLWWLARQA